MKKYTLKFPLSLLSVLLIALFAFTACDKEGSGTGTIQFKAYNPLVSVTKSSVGHNAAPYQNPDLTGETTETYMESLRICIGDVWISKSKIKEGKPDDFEWIKLTTTTNQELKLFEDYSFSPVEIPSGKYNSLKITFKNRFYRICRLISNLNIKYELLETMGSWSDPCDENDESWVEPEYHCEDGSFRIVNGVFHLQSSGVKMSSFTVPSGKTINLIWRFGAGATESCTNYLIDKNGNRKWDCGVDKIDISCPPSVKYMWDFVAQ